MINYNEKLRALAEIRRSMTPSNFEEKLALLKKDFSFWSIDKDLEMTMRISVFPRTKFVGQELIFNGGLAKAQKDGKCGYIDYDLKEVIPFEYDECWNFFEGCDNAIVGIGNKQGIINKQGNLIVPIIYDSIGDHGFEWSEYAKVGLNGKFGVVDRHGHISPIIYDRIDWQFENQIEKNLSCIRKNPVGVILKNNRVSKKEAIEF